MTLKEKIYDLKNKRKAAIDAAQALVLEGKVDSEDYKGKKAEIDGFNRQVEALEELLAEDAKSFGSDSGGGVEKGLRQVAADGHGSDDDDGAVDAVKAFAEAARSGFPTTKDMSEGSNEDGGYTVPEDIVYRVEKLRESKASLRQLVGVETVTTNKGRRTFKKRTQQTGFTKVAEGGKIPKKNSPQFSILNYAISTPGSCL